MRDIGYLVEEPSDFTIETADVDEEVTTQAGPQLVVPALNARFQLQWRFRTIGNTNNTNGISAR